MLFVVVINKETILNNLVSFYYGQPIDLITKIALKHVKELTPHDLVRIGVLIGKRQTPIQSLSKN